MSVLQEILSEFCDEPDHVIVLLSLSININGKIWLVGSQVQPRHIVHFAHPGVVVARCALRERLNPAGSGAMVEDSEWPRGCDGSLGE